MQYNAKTILDLKLKDWFNYWYGSKTYEREKGAEKVVPNHFMARYPVRFVPKQAAEIMREMADEADDRHLQFGQRFWRRIATFIEDDSENEFDVVVTFSNLSKMKLWLKKNVIPHSVHDVTRYAHVFKAAGCSSRTQWELDFNVLCNIFWLQKPSRSLRSLIHPVRVHDILISAHEAAGKDTAAWRQQVKQYKLRCYPCPRRWT